MADSETVDLSLEKLTFDLSKATPLKATRGKKRAGQSGHKPRRRAAPGQVFEAPEHNYNATIASKPGLSLLESLPFDIIERIFLESCNPHLLRAAPVIGSTLSNSHTYNEFCRRLFCLPVHGRSSTAISPPASPPKTPANAAQRQKLLERERRAGAHYRSLALESRWATYEFLSAFDESIARSKDLWFGSFSCEIPLKLLKWPMSKIERRFFFALATAGASVDSKSLAGEVASDVWRGAMHSHDAPILICLVERYIGRLPSQKERYEALKQNNFSLDLMRTFRYLRTVRERRVCASNGARANRFPEDWSEEWPLDDPIACASAMDKLNVTREGLAELLAVNSSHSGSAWRIRFGKRSEDDDTV